MENVMGGTYSTHGQDVKLVHFLVENLEVRGNMEGLGVDERIIRKRALKVCSV
jgi:uncharacterized secreted protein with C-terminal beta-propeller domain